MKPVASLLVFGVAIWALSEGWAALRRTWQAPDPGGLAATLGYLALFVAAFLVLGYGPYAADRAAGRVRRSFWLYEWVLRRRDRRLTDGR